jgi:hypothetical protein
MSERNYLYLTEDCHVKADCPQCEAAEHIDFLTENDMCQLCLHEQEEDNNVDSTDAYEQTLNKYMDMMPKGITPILTKEDHKCDPYMSLQDYVESREWHKPFGPVCQGFFTYEGGWDITLRHDNAFELGIVDHGGATIEFGISYNLHDLEILLHAYESLRYNHRVW